MLMKVTIVVVLTFVNILSHFLTKILIIYQTVYQKHEHEKYLK